MFSFCHSVPVWNLAFRTWRSAREEWTCMIQWIRSRALSPLTLLLTQAQTWQWALTTSSTQYTTRYSIFHLFYPNQRQGVGWFGAFRPKFQLLSKIHSLVSKSNFPKLRPRSLFTSCVENLSVQQHKLIGCNSCFLFCVVLSLLPQAFSKCFPPNFILMVPTVCFITKRDKITGDKWFFCLFF